MNDDKGMGKHAFFYGLCALVIGLTIDSLVGCKAPKVSKGDKAEKSLVHITDKRKIDLKTDVTIDVPPWRKNVDTKNCACCRGARCTCGKTCRCKCKVKVQTPRVNVEVR